MRRSSRKSKAELQVEAAAFLRARGAAGGAGAFSVAAVA